MWMLLLMCMCLCDDVMQRVGFFLLFSKFHPQSKRLLGLHSNERSRDQGLYCLCVCVGGGGVDR